jgi:hypothetical protein
MLRRLILAGLTLAAAISLVDQLATRNGVGVFEYIVGMLLVAALAFVSFLETSRLTFDASSGIDLDALDLDFVALTVPRRGAEARAAGFAPLSSSRTHGSHASW